MRFAIAVLCCFLGALAASPIAAAPSVTSLDALLARARTSSGSPYLYHIVSRSRETTDGRTFDVTTETQGLKYRAARCYKNVCSGFYFDGDHSYDANFNGTALPLSSSVDGLQLTLRAIASYAFTAPDFRAKGGQLVEHDGVSRAGKTYRQIGVAPRFGALLNAIVDPDTGIVVGVVSDERRLAFEFRDERKVDGKLLLPYAIALNGTVIETFDERRVVPEPLTAPAGLVPTITATTPVPFRKLDRDSPQPVVPCTIGGQTVSCLLDTGNSALSMSLELTEKLGLEPEKGAFGVSGLGQYVTGIVKAPALTVGGATYPSAQYVVLHDLHQYGYDVVLGADAFAHARVAIDYGAKTVTFEPGSASVTSGDMTFDDFIPFAPVKLGETTLRLAIDTGDEAAIDVSNETYTQHPGLFKPTGTAAISGIGGQIEQTTGTIPAVRFEGYRIVDVRIGASKVGTANAGHVGSALFEHFRMTFDYAHARIELTPNAGDAGVSAASTTSAVSP